MLAYLVSLHSEKPPVGGLPSDRVEDHLDPVLRCVFRVPLGKLLDHELQGELLEAAREAVASGDVHGTSSSGDYHSRSDLDCESGDSGEENHLVPKFGVSHVEDGRGEGVIVCHAYILPPCQPRSQGEDQKAPNSFILGEASKRSTERVIQSCGMLALSDS